MELAGRVALVTGGAGAGSGAAISRRLAAEGAAVAVADVDVSRGEEVVREIASRGGRASFVRADVAVVADLRLLVERCERELGGLDVVVNNASAAVPEEPLERWEETLAVDLLAPVRLTRLAINAMRRRGGGAIVNIASTSALGHGRKHSPWPAYDVAKAGVIRLTTGLAALGAEGIRVNCLVPDWISSPPVQAFFDSLTVEQRREHGAPHVLTSTEEIAEAVVRLLRDDELAGRVLVWWSGQEPHLIATDDPGYANLEDPPRRARARPSPCK